MARRPGTSAVRRRQTTLRAAGTMLGVLACTFECSAGTTASDGRPNGNAVLVDTATPRRTDDTARTRAGRRGPGTIRSAPSDAAELSLPLGLPAGYALLRDTLGSVTRVPVLVPRQVLGDLNDDSVYVLVPSVDSTGYWIIFSPEAWCSGGSVCRFGSMTGGRKAAGEGPPSGRRVHLADGRMAYYEPGFCAAGCSDATLTWDAGPYRYAVGIKRGRLDKRLTAMAESVVPLR